MKTIQPALSFVGHASIAAALLLAATSAAQVPDPYHLTLTNVLVNNAQEHVYALPTQATPGNISLGGTLTQFTLKATACNWGGVDINLPCVPEAGSLAGAQVWPKAGDLAIIFWQPSRVQLPTVLLQLGGSTRYPHAYNSGFQWIQGQSDDQTSPGTCNTSGSSEWIGCAGGLSTYNPPCQRAGLNNPGGETFHTNQTYTCNPLGKGGWNAPVPMAGTQVMLAWLPDPNGNTQSPDGQWRPAPDGTTSPQTLFCSIDLTFNGVTIEPIMPCQHPTYRNDSNCTDSCKCAPNNDQQLCASAPTLPVRPVEIRFQNRSGFDPSAVKLLPYSCQSSFATTLNPGSLYNNPDCSEAHLLWRDGLFSAHGPHQAFFNGCGHGPNWDSSTGCSNPLYPIAPSVPMRTMSLADLHPNDDNTYSLWTNHFPNAIWYIGLPQITSKGDYTTVPDVPFYVQWSGSNQPLTGATMEVAGLQCKYAGFDTATNLNYFAPKSPAAGTGNAAWPIQPLGDCEAVPPPSGGGCSQVSNGVDWQQLEITLDGQKADIADISYIDFANVPLRLESFKSGGIIGSTELVESTGFASVPNTTTQIHPQFQLLVSAMETDFPNNLYLRCNEAGQRARATALQAAGPSQSDGTCGNSVFIPPSYPAWATGNFCDGWDSIGNFRPLFEKMIVHQSGNHPWPGHPGVSGCGWMRDWLGAPADAAGDPTISFDYDFVLQVTRDDTITDQTSYTATLTGKVTVHSPPPGSSSTTDSLTIVLGKDTYYSDNRPPILDLTRAIYLAPTPGNMPPNPGNQPCYTPLPTGCTNRPLETLTLMGPNDVSVNDPRLSQAWVTVMTQVDPSLEPDPGVTKWFGCNADAKVTALIGRLMGDAYAGMALGFLASGAANPIIPANFDASNWPSYGTTYPSSSSSSCADCDYGGANRAPGMPFWQTPSGSWWGGSLFPTNNPDGTTSYWSSGCADRIFKNHYSDVVGSTKGMCSAWGTQIYQYTEGGYSHPMEDRLQGYKSGIDGYQHGNDDIVRLTVTIWSGISKTSSTQPWDFNGDGRTDGYELSIILSEWGSCAQVPGGCQSDSDQDGDVDGDDLAYVIGYWTPD